MRFPASRMRQDCAIKPEANSNILKTRKTNMNVNTKDKDTESKIIIDGYKVVATNCQDGETPRDLAEERIREIENRVAEIKAERTSLNRQKHVLTRWLNETRTPLVTDNSTRSAR